MYKYESKRMGIIYEYGIEQSKYNAKKMLFEYSKLQSTKKKKKLDNKLFYLSWSFTV